MIRCAVPIIVAALIGAATASPRIAVVRVSDIHRALDSTKETEAAITAERDEVKRDARRRAYYSVLKELEQISKRLKAAVQDTQNPDTSIRDNLKLEYSLKLQEASTLHREYESFRNERNREINAKLVDQMEKSLAKIHQTAAEVGRKKGFDWVLDISGNTNTGAPFVLYAKDPVDLTPEVLTALGQPTNTTAVEIPR